MLCFVAGALLALSFAPFHWWPVALISLPFLFLRLRTARHWRSAALYSWAFGYGHMMAGTYWVANALTVDMQQFGWLVPVSVLGLSLVMAVWFALFGALFRLSLTGRARADLLRFAVLWVVVEYLRSLGIFGFPWNLMGSAMLASMPVAQVMAYVGPYGAGLIAVCLALLPVCWLLPDMAKRRAVLTGAALLLLAGLYGLGVYRMPEKAAVTETRLRVVQGNIPQSLKWEAQGRDLAVDSYTRLTHADSVAAVPPLVIWPETAWPATLREVSPWTDYLGAMLPKGGMLLTGMMRSTGDREHYKLYNSMVAIDAQGRVRETYDKHQLVPFGEFVPFRNVLPIDKITPGAIDFSRGAGPRTLALEGWPAFRPLVCYEVVFPWLSAGGERPAWLLNVTNDAWYGRSPGPFQHFDTARMRAIEQGLPMVRAANTGISAILDPYGRPQGNLGLDVRGFIDGFLPEALPATWYARYGECTALTILALCWFVTITSFFRRK